MSEESSERLVTGPQVTMTAPAEAKVKAGAASGAVTGAIIWALVSFVPSFRSGVPEPVSVALPFALGWLGHVIAAWQAPHTHRPAAEPAPPAPPAS